MALEAGRKSQAKEVAEDPLELNPEPNTDEEDPAAEPERDVIDLEAAKQPRHIDPGFVNDPQSTTGDDRRRLGAAEREKIIARYRQALQRLTTGEKQKVEEYYRILRDIQ